MYNVIVSSEAEDILVQYTIACNMDNGPDCARRLVASYEKGISLLEFSPMRGCARLKYVPKKYRVTNFWPHLWFVFQISENEKTVYIDYIIDDRQNYGAFLS